MPQEVQQIFPYSDKDIEEKITTHITSSFDEVVKKVFQEFGEFDSEQARETLQKKLKEITTTDEIWNLFEGIERLSVEAYEKFSSHACQVTREIREPLLERLTSHEEPFFWAL